MHTFNQNLAHLHRCANVALQKELTRASPRLKVDPFNPFLQMDLVQIHHQVKLSKVYHVRGAQLQARLHWLKSGDRMTKEYVLRLHPPNKAMLLKVIYEGDERLTTTAAILQPFTSPYM